MPITPAHATRAATALAIDLPGVLLEARRLASRAHGVHGRRRAGMGEDFWQFRDHRSEDGQRLVDWRRSARGDRLFVREREMQAAQAAQVWIDPDPGFAWTSTPTTWPTKQERALIVCVAFGILLTRAGERIGALGGATHAGARAPERLAQALLTLKPPTPPQPTTRASVILATDGYAPIDVWGERFAPIVAAGAHGTLLLISDPAEEDFPYSGRVLFQEPGSTGRETMFGRAEDARTAYATRFAAHRTELRALADRMGLVVVTHRTDRPAAPLLSAMAMSLAERMA